MGLLLLYKKYYYQVLSNCISIISICQDLRTRYFTLIYY